MIQLRPHNAIAVVSAAAGVMVTLLAASAVSREDPQLEAAEADYRSQSATEIQRVQATFDRLAVAAEERARINAIHQAVDADPELDAQLRTFYDWWIRCNPAQREDLKSLPSEEWVAEVQRQFAEERDTDAILISLSGQPFRRGPNDRRPTLRVDPKQLENFLTAALSPDQLRPNEQRLLEGIMDQDRPLAHALFVFDHVFSDRNPRDTADQIDRVFQALVTHVLPHFRRRIRGTQDPIPGTQNQSAKSGIVIGTLRAIIEHFRPDFVRRMARSNEELARTFAELEASHRLRLMASDPEVAAADLRSQLISAEHGEPNARLARALAAFDRRWRTATWFLRRPGNWRAPRDMRDNRRRELPGRNTPFSRNDRPGAQQSRPDRPRDGN